MAVLAFAAHASATIWTFNDPITAIQEVIPNASHGLGSIIGTYDDVSKILSHTTTFSGLVAGTSAAHFHGPALPGVNASVQIGLAGFPVGVTSGVYSNSHALTALQETQFLGGLWYVNIHTTFSPGGEIRGQLNPVPGPATAALLALGGVMAMRRRRTV